MCSSLALNVILSKLRTFNQALDTTVTHVYSRNRSGAGTALTHYSSASKLSLRCNATLVMVPCFAHVLKAHFVLRPYR